MKRLAAALLATIVVGVGLSLWLFPRAFPAVALERRATREQIVQRADSFFRATGLAPERFRTAVRFAADETLLTFVDLAGGGKDTLDALVRGQDVAPFTWRVRAFTPGEPREVTVHFAPDGRLVGFEQRLAEAERRPAVSSDSGRVMASEVLADWLREPRDRWTVVSESYETRPVSERVDRSYTFERIDRRVGGAPIRLEVVIHGDKPGKAVARVVTPQSFLRRYDEMRSANDRLALLANLGILLLVVAALATLRVYSRQHAIRWRPAMAVGAAVGLLVTATLLNEVPSSWYGYDTATSASVFQVQLIAGAVLGGAGMMLIVGVTLAAAEVLTRHAFPHHLDWWKLWRHRGTPEVAGRVLGGYAAAAAGFAYVALFYVITRRYLGWWVPSELLDNPNQIATPAPWLAGIAMSAQAAIWEEALFRAIPMSLVALWAAEREQRAWWIAGGVVLSALVFGFAHANYPSWPPYSRGAEIFLEAAVWALLFVRFGLLVTVVAHFAYNLALFGMFAAAGSGLPYRVTAAVTVVALFAPALAVVWRWIRQKGLVPLPDEARFGAWQPPAPPKSSEDAKEWLRPAVTGRARLAAYVAAGLALGAAALLPPRPSLGPPFTADRVEALAAGDQAMRARGEEPSRWRRLVATSPDTLQAWRRFLRQEDAVPLASALAGTYAIPVWWIVRYVHDTADVQARAEEWRVRVLPNGDLLDVRHILSEDTPRRDLSPEEARRRARAALAAATLDTVLFAEAQFDVEPRPARRDVTVTYTDTSVHLPGGAQARAWTSLAGDEVLMVRRGVSLPESFLREERLQLQRRVMLAAPFILALVALVIGGVVVVLRRRPVHTDARLSRGTMLALTASLAVVVLAQSVNMLPQTLSGYDTALAWEAFLQRVGLEQALSLIGVLLIAALWMVVMALARRVGVPLAGIADVQERGRSAVLSAALGLGGVAALGNLLVAELLPRPIPRSPTTTLESVFPVLTPALGALTSVAILVPFVAIPALAAAGLSRRRAGRFAFAALLLICAAGAAISSSGLLAAWGPPQSLPVLAAVAAVIAAVMTWGRAGIVAWIGAALLMHGLESVRMAAVAPTAVERAAGVLSVAVAMGLFVAVLRWGERHASELEPAA